MVAKNFIKLPKESNIRIVYFQGVVDQIFINGKRIGDLGFTYSEGELHKGTASITGIKYVGGT